MYFRRNRTFLAILITFIGCAGALYGGTFNRLFDFPSEKFHTSELVQGNDGNFYGTTQYAGAHFKGTIFRLTPAGVLTTLHEFSGQTDGAFPSGRLAKGNDGNFYGTTMFSSDNGNVFKISPTGVFSIVYRFTGQLDGYSPSPLILATDGDFYGVTVGGGDPSGGTVFKVTSAGTHTTIASLPEQSYQNTYPPPPLIQGSDGHFYGVTNSGGANSGGSIFKVTSSGTLTILHDLPFSGSQNIVSALCEATDGNFYGVNERDGTHGQGCVYKITPDGSYTVVYNFAGSTDGARPLASLVSAPDGNLYGTTSSLGAGSHGTLFKLTLGGTLTTLKAFSNDSQDGGSPEAALGNATDGHLRGVTSDGGANNHGTAFQLSSAGTLTTSYSFVGLAFGSNPTSLIQGKDGSIYGATSAGGLKNRGAIFKRSAAGNVTPLYSFSGQADGAVPSALIQAANGNFYGTTNAGSGPSSAGTIFRITPAGAFATCLHSRPMQAKGVIPPHSFGPATEPSMEPRKPVVALEKGPRSSSRRRDYLPRCTISRDAPMAAHRKHHWSRASTAIFTARPPREVRMHWAPFSK